MRLSQQKTSEPYKPGSLFQEGGLLSDPVCFSSGISCHHFHRGVTSDLVVIPCLEKLNRDVTLLLLEVGQTENLGSKPTMAAAHS